MSSDNQTIFFVSSLLIVTFMPLQGMWNLIIYLRPVYRKIAQQHPEYTISGRLFATVLGTPWQRRVGSDDAVAVTTDGGDEDDDDDGTVGSITTGELFEIKEEDDEEDSASEVDLSATPLSHCGSFMD